MYGFHLENVVTFGAVHVVKFTDDHNHAESCSEQTTPVGRWCWIANADRWAANTSAAQSPVSMCYPISCSCSHIRTPAGDFFILIWHSFTSRPISIICVLASFFERLISNNTSRRDAEYRPTARRRRENLWKLCWHYRCAILVCSWCFLKF